jgi:phosphoglucosamine mutase
LTADFVRYPQILLNVPVAEKKPIESLSGFSDAVEKVEGALGGRGRVLVRYSGTEPKARIMVEGEDEKRIREYANELAEALRRALGG